jgi:hypothetical protein
MEDEYKPRYKWRETWPGEGQSKERVINLRDHIDSRKAYDKAVQEQFHRLGRPLTWRDAWAPRARRKKSKALANADPEFYILSRSINISATWLSVVAVTLKMDLNYPDDDEEFSNEQKAISSYVFQTLRGMRLNIRFPHVPLTCSWSEGQTSRREIGLSEGSAQAKLSRQNESELSCGDP